MRPAAIAVLAIFATTVAGVTATPAFSTGTIVIQSGSKPHKGYVRGAPLYAGPNVVIIGGDRSYGRRHGGSFKYGNVWRQPRYQPYIQPYAERYPRHAYPRHNRVYRERYPRYSVAPPYYDRRYDDHDRYGRGRGYDRHDHYPRLTILGATYRSIDGRACDAFAHVHKKCDGSTSCRIKAKNSICGDPDRGRLKVLEVTYACGNQRLNARVPEKSRSTLRCR